MWVRRTPGELPALQLELFLPVAVHSLPGLSSAVHSFLPAPWPLFCSSSCGWYRFWLFTPFCTGLVHFVCCAGEGCAGGQH